MQGKRLGAGHRWVIGDNKGLFRCLCYGNKHKCYFTPLGAVGGWRRVRDSDHEVLYLLLCALNLWPPKPFFKRCQAVPCMSFHSPTLRMGQPEEPFDGHFCFSGLYPVCSRTRRFCCQENKQVLAFQNTRNSTHY